MNIRNNEAPIMILKRSIKSESLFLPFFLSMNGADQVTWSCTKSGRTETANRRRKRYPSGSPILPSGERRGCEKLETLKTGRVGQSEEELKENHVLLFIGFYMLLCAHPSLLPL